MYALDPQISLLCWPKNPERCCFTSSIFSEKKKRVLFSWFTDLSLCHRDIATDIMAKRMDKNMLGGKNNTKELNKDSTISCHEILKVLWRLEVV